MVECAAGRCCVLHSTTDVNRKSIGMDVWYLFDLTTSVQYEVETTSHSKFLQHRKEDYSRDGVEIIVIPLARLPGDSKEREKVLGGWVWG